MIASLPRPRLAAGRTAQRGHGPVVAVVIRVAAAIVGQGLCMSLMRRLRIWAGSVGLRRKIAIALAMAALASGIATYLALTGAPPFGPDPSAVLSLL